MNPSPAQSTLADRNCDYVWSRRSRRSFRLLVALCIMFTGALWFSEGYLRYDQNETQYRMSLTLHPAQARPILRAVVRREEEIRETPTARYVEALALVEEPDRVLPILEMAYHKDLRNNSLIINYGCFLFLDGQYEEARERFREAGVNPPRNALPRYLEAAALMAGLAESDDLSDVMALLTRANTSDDPVLMPEPLWHESLPRGGRRFAEARDDIAWRIATPLAQCASLICERAEVSLARGASIDWDDWLDRTQTMGIRLMGCDRDDTTPTTTQFRAALEIQRMTARLRARISEAADGVVNPSHQDAVARVTEGLNAIDEFESERDRLSRLHYRRLWEPVTLIAETGALLAAVYLLGCLLHAVGSGSKRARAVSHPPLGLLAPVTGVFLLLLLLLLFTLAHRNTSPQYWEPLLPLAWRMVLAPLLILGTVYPLIMARSTLLLHPPHGDAPPRYSWRRYVGVYGCLLRRYVGVLSGGVIMGVCFWLLAHRIFFDCYPFQFELLTSGLQEESAAIIHEIAAHLAEGRMSVP